MLQELRAFLPMAEKVKARNPTMPILNHLCVENRSMRITDLNTTVIIPVDDDRSFTLPITIMKQILKQRPAEMDIQLQERNKVQIRYDGNCVTFPAMEFVEYPSIPKGKYAKIGIWPPELFLQLFKQLDFVSRDELKPALNGIWIKQDDTLISCATDGHYMEYMENLQELDGCTIANHFEGILSAKVITIMARFFRSSITVSGSENFIRFELPNGIQVYSRLIDEHFPDIDAILKHPKSNTITLDKKELLRAIKSCLPFTNSETKLGVLSVKNGAIAIMTKDHENAIDFNTSIQTLKRKGVEVDIGFNMAFLEKVVNSISSDTINWLYENNTSACLFRSPDNDDKTHLLMPVRLEED